jgi:hypothetical protein
MKKVYKDPKRTRGPSRRDSRIKLERIKRELIHLTCSGCSTETEKDKFSQRIYQYEYRKDYVQIKES